MKKKSDWLMIILILIFSSIIFGFFYKTLHKQNKNVITVNPFKDSLELFDFQKTYLTQLLNTGFQENGRISKFDTIKVYELNDNSKQKPKSLTSLFVKQKNKLVIRYTEIGCNACADSTFRYIKNYKKLDSIFDIVVLVDFNNYDSYLKWRKISEIVYPVLWIKKGDLPFRIEEESSSYIFTVTPFMEVNNFFIPNSQFANYIKNYFSNLELK